MKSDKKVSKKIGKKVNNTISNAKKYAWRITLFATLLLGLILIGRPLISAIKTTVEIHKLNKQKATYEASIRRDSTLLENLKDDQFLEKYAREKYFMYGKDEEVFIVEE